MICDYHCPVDFRLNIPFPHIFWFLHRNRVGTGGFTLTKHRSVALPPPSLPPPSATALPPSSTAALPPPRGGVRGARLGFDYWAPGPGFPYCGTTVMVIPLAGMGRTVGSERGACWSI